MAAVSTPRCDNCPLEQENKLFRMCSKHLICESCLDQLIENTGSRIIECPLCEKVVDDETVQHFKVQQNAIVSVRQLEQQIAQCQQYLEQKRIGVDESLHKISMLQDKVELHCVKAFDVLKNPSKSTNDRCSAIDKEAHQLTDVIRHSYKREVEMAMTEFLSKLDLALKQLQGSSRQLQSVLPRTPPPVPRRSERLNRRKYLNQTQYFQQPAPQLLQEQPSRLSRTRTTLLSTLRWFRVENLRKLPTHVAHGFTIIKRQSVHLGRTAMSKLTNRTTVPENSENEHYYESIDPC